MRNELSFLVLFLEGPISEVILYAYNFEKRTAVLKWTENAVPLYDN